MIHTASAGSRHWIVTALIFAFGVPFGAAAQESPSGIASKLERAGVIDAYFPDVALEVASALATSSATSGK